jgi:hypothetical protein
MLEDYYNLSIWDSVEDSNAEINQTIWFYANYTNESIFITGATCNITFNDSSSLMNESNNNYNFSRNFSFFGTYTWNVKCNKTDYPSLNVSDIVTIGVCNNPSSGNWTITGNQECNNRNINLGSGKIYINPPGKLILSGSTNITTSALEINTTYDTVFINQGSKLIIT